MCWISDYNKDYGASPIEAEKQRNISIFSDLELMTALFGKKYAAKACEMFSSKDIDYVKEIKETDSFKLKAIFELGRRHFGNASITIQTPEDIHRVMSHIAYDNQESMHVILLDGAHSVMDKIMVTKGLLNRTMVHPREIFAPAIKNRAASIVVVHNHPSGNPIPSEEDKAVTTKLVEAGKILGIGVLDHVIIARKGYYSFVEHSLM